MLILLVGASLFSARVPVADILYAHWTYAVPVFNIAVFCYAVQYIVPEISRGFTHDPGKIVPSILAGAGISFVILALVPLRSSSCCQSMKFRKSHPCPGAVPWDLRSSSSSSTLSLSVPCSHRSGHCRKLLDQYDRPPGFKSETDIRTRAGCLAFIVIPPVLLAYSGLVGFVNAIFSAGTFGGIIMSILPVFMLRSARKHATTHRAGDAAGSLTPSCSSSSSYSLPVPASTPSLAYAAGCLRRGRKINCSKRGCLQRTASFSVSPLGKN